ncbi:PLDc N-terminal domain-containing protein [Opitutia bacterium ISCC 51]|nr:PLDc N-terminal domain-containing protein [Opitutae bacterium ISCC 51]QXD29465.1 PLDc N-terminal domain-containing protein [Opitutae bacterium ISCC 52]
MTLAFLQGLGPMEILIVLFLFGFIPLWISALISVARRTDLPSNLKILWIVFLIIFSFATPIVYWIVRLANRKKGIPDIKTFEQN